MTYHLLEDGEPGPVYVSADPAGSDAGWHQADLHLPDSQEVDVEGFACPSSQLCVVAMQDGSVFTSGDPGGGLPWSEQHLPVASSLTGIACPSSQLCVAVDDAGDVFSSTTPASGRWHEQPVDPGGTATISCFSEALCFLEDQYDGQLFASSDPGDASATWHRSVLASEGSVAAACPSVSFCLSTVSALYLPDTVTGSLFMTADPVDGPWTQGQRIDGSNPLKAVSCAGDGVCAAIDTARDVLTSTDPSGGADDWDGERIDGAYKLESVSCASRALCVVSDSGGGVLTSTDPTHGAGTWARAEIAGGNALGSIDCPSVSFCIVTDGSGQPLYARRPKDGASAWRRLGIGARIDLRVVLCASSSRCLAGAVDGYVFASSKPMKARAWRRTKIRGVGSSAISSIACPSRSLCLLTDTHGDLIDSRNPWSRSPKWRIESRGSGSKGGNRYTGVACASAHLCTAVDGTLVDSDYYEYIVAGSTDPAGGASKWGLYPDGYEPVYGDISGVACRPDTTTCVAVEDTGFIDVSR